MYEQSFVEVHRSWVQTQVTDQWWFPIASFCLLVLLAVCLYSDTKNLLLCVLPFIFYGSFDLSVRVYTGEQFTPMWFTAFNLLVAPVVGIAVRSFLIEEKDAKD